VVSSEKNEKNSGHNSGSNSGQGKVALVVLAALIALGGGIAALMYPSASNQGYAPEQPIPFSHKLHAGQYKMPCAYCHVGVEKSRHASVPSLNICMNCHSVVKTDSPYIKKIRESYAAGKPIEWVRVHELPDFVYFPHKRHVAKGVACQTCHGPVEEMTEVYQFGQLSMGWCVNCHREYNANPPENLKDKHIHASIDCTGCHH
jgi:hypothetical protein